MTSISPVRAAVSAPASIQVSARDIQSWRDRLDEAREMAENAVAVMDFKFNLLGSQQEDGDQLRWMTNFHLGVFDIASKVCAEAAGRELAAAVTWLDSIPGVKSSGVDRG